MSTKTYISANEFLQDSWLLASKVRKSGWQPNVLIALWRGGAGVGVAVHEFFKATGWGGLSHYPLKCSSYTGIGESSSDVSFTLLDETLAFVDKAHKVLVVDDVLDTGKTAEAIKHKIESHGAEVKLAVVYRKPTSNQSRVAADYYARDLGEEWIVFPHEIEGLSRSEIFEKDPALAELLKG